MGMTIEFYSAQAEEFVPLFASLDEGLSQEQFDALFDKVEAFPKADFSLHLWYPEDMDGLCSALRKQFPLVPSNFSDLFAKQLWDDSVSESLTLLDGNFAVVMAGLSDEEIERVALDWTKAFPYQVPIRDAPAYQALLQLRRVSQDVVMRKASLIVHLEGNSLFLR